MVAVIGGAIAYTTGGKPTGAQPEPNAGTQPSGAQSAAITVAEPIVPPTPSGQPEPRPPKPPAKPAETIHQCVARHFAADAFRGKLPKFDFVCEMTDPRRAAINLKTRLVYAQPKGRPVADAMKEWSILNWYELAFVSIAQQACCEQPPILNSLSQTCDFDERITAIGIAGHRGEGIDEAIAAYDKAVQCLINFSLSGHYKQKHPTYGPERDVFKRISKRSRGEP